MQTNLIASQPTATEALEHSDFLRLYAERYQMVLFTFRRNVRPQVKEIWRSMIDRDRGQNDQALAERLGISMSTAAVIRHRLRQRLEVFRFFEEPRDQRPDLPGDLSVLEWVEARWGIDDKAIPTLRKLATLARAAQGEGTPPDSPSPRQRQARAAQGEGTLGWALLARACTDTEQDRDEMSETAQAMIKRLAGSSANFQQRLETYRLWIDRPWFRDRITELRDLTKKSNAGFLLAPCWYLDKLRAEPLESILTTLNPTAKEKLLIEHIVRRLQ